MQIRDDRIIYILRPKEMVSSRRINYSFLINTFEMEEFKIVCALNRSERVRFVVIPKSISYPVTQDGRLIVTKHTIV